MREYKAITKTPMIPTRSNGMGKLMVEIIDIHLLSNNIILRDWIIIHDENGKEVCSYSVEPGNGYTVIT